MLTESPTYPYHGGSDDAETGRYQNAAQAYPQPNSLREYVGMEDMKLVPCFLCLIVAMIACLFVVILLGVFAVTANSGSAHHMVDYVHTISELTEDVKNAGDFVRANIPEDTNFSQVIQNISLALRNVGPKDMEEWNNVTSGARKTLRSASAIVQSVDDSNVFYAAGNLLKSAEDAVERPSFVHMMRTAERFAPILMNALETDKAIEGYQVVLTVLDYIPSALDVVVPWFTGDAPHDQVEEIKTLLHVLAQPEVTEGISAVGGILSEGKHLLHEVRRLLEEDDVREDIQKFVRDVGNVRWRHVGEKVLDGVDEIKHAVGGERGQEVMGTVVMVIREVGLTLKSIREKVDSGDATHAFREIVDLIDMFNKVSHLLADKAQ